MANSNQFLPFAGASGANVLSSNSYTALTARLTGFQSGIALSQQVNKPLRQGTAIAAMIGAFIADYGGDALDNGDLATLQTNFEAALAHIVEENLPAGQDLSGYLLKSGGTMTGLLRAPAGFQTTARTLISATTLTTADSGKFIEITASSTIITSLPTPVGNGGVSFIFCWPMGPICGAWWSRSGRVLCKKRKEPLSVMTISSVFSKWSPAMKA